MLLVICFNYQMHITVTDDSLFMVDTPEELQCQLNIKFYFIPSSELNAYLKQIKLILSAVKKYRIFHW